MSKMIEKIETEVRKSFDHDHRIFSFFEYIEFVRKNPLTQIRGSAQYVIDMLNSFGKSSTDTLDLFLSNNTAHYKLFDMEFDDKKSRVIGQENVITEIVRTLEGFIREGINNKLILLHGPNGSAKSSIVNCFMKGMEKYGESPDGALYKFNWIFPIDKIVKGQLGLGTYSGMKVSTDTYARLGDDEIACKIHCEIKDHPLLLLPVLSRNEFIQEVMKKDAPNRPVPDYLTKGLLSQKSKLIFDALLNSYKGDLHKVLMHIQVERFYISKKYRVGAITIEPQMHVDAQSRQVSMDRNISQLPVSLQSLSLFDTSGDLVDGNRGMVEYADLLKRPVDTFKYLLMTCESGSANLGNTAIQLDTVWIGSSNELQLDAFKEYPDFISFKARTKLIRVPYLLSYHKEKEIYDVSIQKIAGPKFITPHTTMVAALWAVLTRLKKPNSVLYPTPLSTILSEFKPIDKARFFASGEMPENLNADERKTLKNSMQKIYEEYANIPYYEGRIGASAREIKTVLYDAASDQEYQTLSPLSLFRALDEFVKRTSEHEFLRQETKDGYHDCVAFIEVVKKEHLQWIDREVKESMGLISTSQYEEYIKRYVMHLSHSLKKEKLKNQITGAQENPDLNLIDEFEQMIEAPQGVPERELFRQNVISTIGAFALNNPRKQVDYTRVFPDFIRKLENHYFEKQKHLMRKIGDAIELFGTDRENTHDENHQLAKQTIKSMIDRFHYSDHCAPQTIQYLVKSKY